MRRATRHVSWATRHGINTIRLGGIVPDDHPAVLADPDGFIPVDDPQYEHSTAKVPWYRRLFR